MVIADFLTVSVPRGAGLDLRDALTDVCLALPGSQTDPLGVRVGKFGLLRFQDRPTVAVASASGSILTALRAASLLHDYCAAVASVGAHRVTQVHAAHDVECDAPAELQRIYSTVRGHGVRLTRKTIPPAAIKTILSPGVDGRDTGSIMVGHRARHETTLCIYDRLQDALEKGKPDPGNTLRYELRTSVDGLTLRDACEPAPVFYHFMGAFFPRPDGVPSWVPHGEGFDLPKLQTDDHAKLRRLVNQSVDLCRMIDLADTLPGEGLDVLLHLVRSRAKTRRHTRAFAAVGAASPATAGNSGDDLPTAVALDA